MSDTVVAVDIEDAVDVALRERPDADRAEGPSLARDVSLVAYTPSSTSEHH